jgi:NAD(P)-dependent dehydrogenase (short-subunit alcohol dehydrogenase family)
MRKQHPAIVALDTLAGFGSDRAVIKKVRYSGDTSLRSIRLMQGLGYQIYGAGGWGFGTGVATLMALDDIGENAAQGDQANCRIRGGRSIAVRCDHRVDAEVEAVFARVRMEQGRLDLLVNNAFASPEQRVLWSGQRFWQIPVQLWDDIIDVGLRSHFVATRYAAQMMIGRGRGPCRGGPGHPGHA